MRAMTADQRERYQEGERERYNMLFEAIHLRKLQEFFIQYGIEDGDYKPDWAEIDREVKQVMTQEYVKRQVGKALGDEL